ncbi:unnamed protein product [Phytomonas sp. EM1]|nr:unnamed protein product [Phytomonas sp. EM1]|eukprot:CCW60089.1 unnamed protein product [Phytomonas sp. isolate EM1]
MARFDPKLALCGAEEVRKSLTAMQLTPENAKTLYRCERYYLTLSRYTACYLVHKALQLLLLPPYGVLHRLLTQLFDVCLLQKEPVAARMVDLWGDLVEKAFRSSLFEAASRDFSRTIALAELNEHFQKEWQRCVLCSSGAEEVYWRLETEKGKRERPDDEAGSSSSETAPMKVVRGPLGFLSQLRLCYTESTADPAFDEPASGETPLQLLPEGFIARYGELFTSLLRWKTMESYATSTWRLGFRGGQVVEVSFFSNTARYLLITMQRSMWDRLCGLCANYRASLRFEQGIWYTYTSLDDFTQEHRFFLQECRFAAMLDGVFTPIWGLFTRLMRLIESVRRLLKTVAGEMAVERRRILAAHHLLDLYHGSDPDSASDASSEGSRSTSASASSTASSAGMPARGKDRASGLPPLTGFPTTTSPASSKTKSACATPRGKKLHDDAAPSKPPSTTSTPQSHPSNREVDRSKKINAHASTIKDARPSAQQRTPKVYRKKRKTRVKKATSAASEIPKASETLAQRQKRYRITRRKILEAHEPLHRRLRDGIKLHLRGLATITEELITGLCHIRDVHTLKELGEVQNAIHGPFTTLDDSAQKEQHQRSEGSDPCITDSTDRIMHKKWVEYRRRVLTERISFLTTLINPLQTTLDLLNRKI